MKVDINANVILRVCAWLLLIFFGWYFSSLVLYLFLAFIFALIGKPIADKINSIRIYKYHVSRGISAFITMLIIILVIVLLMIFLIPMLAREMAMLGNINYDDLSRGLDYLLTNIQNFLYDNGIMDRQETLVGLITMEIKKLASLTTFSNILGGIVSATSSFFFGLFTVCFLTFFFIKDNIRFDGLAQLLFGKQHAETVTIVSNRINHLLSRYFIGLLIEIVTMMVLLYIGMAIFGVKGALLFAFFGGLLNAIPYLGPLIGAVSACLFGTIDCLSISDYSAILPTTITIAGTFIVANMIDNIILQPMIYSQSVKAHPIEIFLVIIMGGSLAGIVGMLFAIPVYTIVRTIVVAIYDYINHKEQAIL